MEIEAKFVVADEDTLTCLEAAENIAGFELLPGQLLKVHDVYLDTADCRLLAAGYACRKRCQDGQYSLTVKALHGRDGAVHRRTELEVQLPGDLSQDQWPSRKIGQLLKRIAKGAELRPMVVLDQSRTVRPVQKGGAVVAEMSLDRVAFTTGHEERRLFEVEIELKGQGTEGDLELMVEGLENGWLVQVEPYSKLERALAFAGVQAGAELILGEKERTVLEQWASQPGRKSRRAIALLCLSDGESREVAAERSHLPVRSVRYWLARFRRERLGILPAPPVLGKAVAGRSGGQGRRRKEAKETPAGELQQTGEALPALPKAPGVTVDDSMAEAARKTLLFHLRRMVYYERGTREGLDTEALHDMRVATRRMRAALDVFGRQLDSSEMRPLLKGLRRTGRILGRVRDLDVFREKAEHYLESLPQDRSDDLAPLMSVWQEQHDSARSALLAYLDSDRYVRFREGFRSFLETPGAGACAVMSADGNPVAYRLSHVAPVAVYERLAAVRAFDEWVRGPQIPLERLHRLRIVAKGLRYTLEFLREILGPEAEAVIDRVKGLQDHLGDLQDAVIASALLRDFLTWGTWGHRSDTKIYLSAEPVVAPGVAAYLAVRQAEIQDLVSRFPAVWEEVADRRFQLELSAALAVLW